MQASTALNNKFQLETQLRSALALEITHHVDQAHNLLLKSGYPTRAYTKSAVDTLLNFDETKQLQVLENAKKLLGALQMLDPEVNPDPDFEIDEPVNEVALTKRALDCFGFKIKDETWEQKAQDRIIEIYNGNGVQLHRSLNFFKTCGYSLLDLCVNEWYVLWERPSQIVKQMNSVITEVLTGTYEAAEVPIDPHVVLESYDDGTTQPFLPRSILVKFRDIFPAYNANNEICGFVVTSEARLLSVGDDALKLNFI